MKRYLIIVPIVLISFFSIYWCEKSKTSEKVYLNSTCIAQEFSEPVVFYPVSNSVSELIKNINIDTENPSFNDIISCYSLLSYLKKNGIDNKTLEKKCKYIFTYFLKKDYIFFNDEKYFKCYIYYLNLGNVLKLNISNEIYKALIHINHSTKVKPDIAYMITVIESNNVTIDNEIYEKICNYNYTVKDYCDFGKEVAIWSFCRKNQKILTLPNIEVNGKFHRRMNRLCKNLILRCKIE